MSIRKQAIEILAVCAATVTSTHGAAKYLRATDKAKELAYKAWEAARADAHATKVPTFPLAAIYAEAQCRLIEGWSPDAK